MNSKEAFVPLLPATAATHETSFIALASKTAAAAVEAMSAGATSSASGNGGCDQPIISLQRNGDVITGIRIQCSCGKVIDLTCGF